MGVNNLSASLNSTTEMMPLREDYVISPEYIFTEEPLSYSIIIYGYMCPPMATLTIVFNVLVIITLVQQKMRSPTNHILISIAVTDMLTAVVLLPFFIYLYTFHGYQHYPSIWLCHVFWPMFRAIPSVLRTASVWLNTVLVIYRYVNVNVLPQIHRGCSSTVQRLVFLVYLISFIASGSRFFEVELDIFKVPNEFNVTTYSCRPVWRQWIQDTMPLYFNIYYLVKNVFGYLIPCLLLMIFNSLLLVTVHQAHRERKRLVSASDLRAARRINEKYCTTMMLIIVIVCTLLSELPRTVIFGLASLQSALKIALIPKDVLQKSGIIMNFLSLTACSTNFVIYYTMSKLFRINCNRLVYSCTCGIAVSLRYRLKIFRRGTSPQGSRPGSRPGSTTFHQTQNASTVRDQNGSIKDTTYFHMLPVQRKAKLSTDTTAATPPKYGRINV